MVNTRKNTKQEPGETRELGEVLDRLWRRSVLVEREMVSPWTEADLRKIIAHGESEGAQVKVPKPIELVLDTSSAGPYLQELGSEVNRVLRAVDVILCGTVEELIYVGPKKWYRVGWRYWLRDTVGFTPRAMALAQFMYNYTCVLPNQSLAHAYSKRVYDPINEWHDLMQYADRDDCVTNEDLQQVWERIASLSEFLPFVYNSLTNERLLVNARGKRSPGSTYWYIYQAFKDYKSERQKGVWNKGPTSAYIAKKATEIKMANYYGPPNEIKAISSNLVTQYRRRYKEEWKDVLTWP